MILRINSLYLTHANQAGCLREWARMRSDCALYLESHWLHQLSTEYGGMTSVLDVCTDFSLLSPLPNIGQLFTWHSHCMPSVTCRWWVWKRGAWSHANTTPFYTVSLDIYELWYLRKALEPISREYWGMVGFKRPQWLQRSHLRGATLTQYLNLCKLLNLGDSVP